jgi:hypothetical protein
MKEFWNDTILSAKTGTISKISRAKKVNLIKINKNTNTACVAEKDYKVSLENCTCYDYEMHQKPCKHMYKLAIDLELMPDFIDLSSIRYKKDITMLINNITNEEANKLLEVLSIFSRQKIMQPLFMSVDDLTLCSLILKKILIPLEVNHPTMVNWFLIVPHEKSIKIIPDLIQSLKNNFK